MTPVARRPRVALFGAGRIGKALRRQFDLLPFEVEVYDSRPAEHEHGTILTEDEMVELGGCLAAGDFAVIATHSHDLDYRLAAAVLRSGQARYCGMIGSRRKRDQCLEHLAAEGLSEGQIAGLTCPIGIASLHSPDAEVIAVAVAAQVLEICQGDAEAG